MTVQPDKLFRDKLENFQRPAPNSAWEKIETGLTKTNQFKLWMKIAAGVALLMVGTFMSWPDTPSENANVTTRRNNGITNPAIEQEIKRKVIPQSETPKQRDNQKNIEPENKIGKKSEPLVAEAAAPTKENESSFVTRSESATQIAALETASVKTNSSRTIVYTAEEVNSKFLRKKLSTEATSEPTKSSGIQKLMGLANDLKNNNTGFGDLRQKKNEILALSFLNEKTTKTKN